ncbi:MAG: NAD(+) synthase [Lachnospiraceae bacterium]|nr:NAD(+) synthase [Lachnospiraceae bacterium]
MKDGFIKVAAVTPQVKVADVDYNTGEIIKLTKEAAQAGARIIVFPKYAVTGATCGDLFAQGALLQAAAKGLERIAEATAGSDPIVFVGLPDEEDGSKVTAVIQNGKVLAKCKKAGDFVLKVSVENTETVFTVGMCFRSGADIVVRPMAEPDLVCSDRMRLQDALAASRRNRCILIEANAGEGESTTDFVYAGHDIIAQCGKRIAESGSFSNGILYGVVDVDLVQSLRRMAKVKQDLTKNHHISDPEGTEITTVLKNTGTVLTGAIRKNPFVSDDEAEMQLRYAHIFMLQVMGLKKRLEHCMAKSAVIGVSGGLDSTLALLVTARAFDLLSRDRKDIHAYTMPCFGTSDRTRNNATDLMELLGVSAREIPIGDAIRGHFRDIGHDENDRNAAYENAQARERTQILMDIANDIGGIVVGTGDLSELALGWATFNGDHMSNYAVNADVPKTLMRNIVGFLADKAEEGFFTPGAANAETAGKLAGTLRDVVDTPVSPELLPPEEGKIAQKTEDLVGPYDLHDFFLYYMLRYGFAPHKIYRMALVAFANDFDAETIRKWIEVFYKRFFSQQFKRSCMPDGPAVGSVGLSPRGGLSMPSDALSSVWLKDLSNL